MERDASLKANDVKMILLMCGDSQTGKKTIVKSIIKNKQFTEKENVSFKSIFFTYEELIGNSKVEIPIEIRILNSDELETELKINKTFFNEALGAFIVNSITDNNSFINGEKWKDKIDLMCCLPNRFPLPIFLIINKCDVLTNDNEKQNLKDLQYSERETIESYSLENQFFNTFLVSQAISNDDDTNSINNTEKKDNMKLSLASLKEEFNIKDLIVSAITPFKEMVKIILGFKEIRNKFIVQSGGVINDDENDEGSKKSKCNIY